MDDLVLVAPTPELAAAFRDMAAEWQASAETKFAEALVDMDAYLERLARQQSPHGPDPDRVPCSTFWLVAGGTRIVGTSRLRHWLVPHLEKEGGNIGYDVRPSERNKGYGTRLCALTLDKARELGLEQVIITCDSDNEASVRIIEKNGGQYVGCAISDDSGKQVNRYRIALVQSGSSHRNGNGGDER